LIDSDTWPSYVKGFIKRSKKKVVGFQYVEVLEGAIERAIKNKGITPGQFQPRMFKRSRVVPLDPMSQSFHEGIGHEVYRNPTGGIRCYTWNLDRTSSWYSPGSGYKSKGLKFQRSHLTLGLV
jgi:hypothetical protein